MYNFMGGVGQERNKAGFKKGTESLAYVTGLGSCAAEKCMEVPRQEQYICVTVQVMRAGCRSTELLMQLLFL